MLDKLAAENSGAADYVEPKEDLEIKVSNFFTKVNSPVLTNLEMDFGSLQTDLLYPRDLTDLFKGTQLTLIGRYRNTTELENITLHLRGKTGKQIKTFNYSNLDFPLRNEKNDFLPRLWATRRVGWLMEQIRTNGEQKELRDEVVDLGTRYGIVTPYTSYLATDGSVKSEAEVSAGSISNNSVGRKLMRVQNSSPNASAPVTGQDAVQASKDAKQLQELTIVRSEDDEAVKTGTVKKLGAKTFYLQNDIWIDSEYKEEAKFKEIKITFASDEFFDLITKEAALAQFFSLGEQVVVVWKGNVYRVMK